MYIPDYKKIIINHDGGEERHTIVIDDYKAIGFSVLTRSKKNFTYQTFNGTNTSIGTKRFRFKDKRFEV